jgi:hypothetical protein
MEDHSVATVVSKQITQHTHQWHEYELLYAFFWVIPWHSEAGALPRRKHTTKE